MPAFDRTTIVRGPCKITYDTQTFYSKGGVTLTQTLSTFDKDSDAYGPFSKAKTDFQIVVEFEPVGEIEALSTLYSYGNTAMGTGIYGSTDKNLVIVAADKTYTIKNAAVTQMPSIRMTAGNTAFGSVQFTGLLALNSDPNTITNYMTIGAGASIGATFDPSKVITAPYTATLGALSFMSEAGFEVSFDLGLAPITVDGIGTVDMALQSLGATITCIPTGVAVDAFQSYFGSLDTGEDLASAQLDIATLTVGGLNFDCAAVQVLDLASRFSPTENRLGQLTMAAKRTFTTGVQNALFTVAAVV